MEESKEIGVGEGIELFHHWHCSWYEEDELWDMKSSKV